MADLILAPASYSPAPTAKSSLRSLYERMLSPVAVVNSQITPYASSAIHLVRAEGEAAIAGLVMAWIEERGIADVRGVPVDGAAAGILAMCSLWLSKNPDGLSVDARNLSAALTGICFYRNYSKMKRVVTEAPAKDASINVSGDDRIAEIMQQFVDEAA